MSFIYVCTKVFEVLKIPDLNLMKGMTYQKNANPSVNSQGAAQAAHISMVPTSSIA